MDRKFIFVIILAGIFALTGAYFIYKSSPNKHKPIAVQEEITIDSEELTIDEQTEKESEADLEQEEKQQEVQPVKNVSYKKNSAPIKKVEVPEIKTLKVEEAVEAVQNDGVVKETNSSEIVITKEYKTETPSHYTFK